MRIQFILKFMCTDKNNDKNKTKPSPPTSSSYSLFLLTVLGKIKRNCMSRLFCIANLLETDKIKTFLSGFICFNLIQTKMK